MFSEPVNLISNSDVYKDSTFTFSVNDVQALPESRFTRIGEEQYNAAFEKVVYWIRTELKNMATFPVDCFYEVSDPHVNELRLFVYQDGQLIYDSGTTGDFYPHSQRPKPGRTFAFPLLLDANSTYTSFLRVDMYGEPILLPARLWEADAFQANATKESLSYGILLGLFCFYLFVAIILLVLFPERDKYYFLLYVLFNFALILSYSGLAYQLIWPNHSVMGNISRPLFAGLTALSLLFFGGEWLKIQHDRKWYVAAWIPGSIITVLSFILPFYRVVPALFLRISISVYYLSIMLLFLIVLAYVIRRLWIAKDRAALAFILALSCLLIGFGVNVLMLHDFIPKNEVTSVIYYYAVAAEMLIFFWFLAREIFQIQLEKERRERELAEERQRSMQNLIEGSEQERNRIALELHDGVGIELAMADQQLQSFLQPEMSPQFRTQTVVARDLLGQLSKRLRQLSHQLSSFVLQQTDLGEAVENLVNQLNQNSTTNYTSDVELEEGMDENTSLHLYRVIQELLMNVEKHAGAANASVMLEQLDGRLEITVRDDGKGFANSVSGGIGMKNIRSRIKLIGGKLEINSRVGEGTRIDIEV